MNINRDVVTASVDAFASLIDGSAASAAALRIYESHDGLRHCAENHECLSAAQARARDARDGRTNGPIQPAPESELPELPRYEAASWRDFDEDDFVADTDDDDHLIDLGDDDDFESPGDELFGVEDAALSDESFEALY